MHVIVIGIDKYTQIIGVAVSAALAGFVTGRWFVTAPKIIASIDAFLRAGTGTITNPAICAVWIHDTDAIRITAELTITRAQTFSCAVASFPAILGAAFQT